MQTNTAVTRSQEAILATNKVVKNTYILLSMTLIVSGLGAFLSVALPIPAGLATIAFFVGFGVLWLGLPKAQNSAAGIPVLFLITALFGIGLGPMLSHYLAVNPNIVTVALGGTGTIFLGLSGYALTTRKDFNFLGGFLFVGILVVFMAILGNIVLGFMGIALPALHLAISAAVILLMSGLILWRTSHMIHGGETNYIAVTADLFIAILNIFVHLMSLLGAFGDD